MNLSFTPLGHLSCTIEDRKILHCVNLLEHLNPVCSPKNCKYIIDFRSAAVLEKQLARVEVERDDLARDVEFLCAQSSSSIFDSSMVLTERVLSSEKELRRVKALVRHQSSPN